MDYKKIVICIVALSVFMVSSYWALMIAENISDKSYMQTLDALGGGSYKMWMMLVITLFFSLSSMVVLLINIRKAKK